MGKLSDERETLNVLYVGEQGRGKTTAMASMAHLGDIIYVDYESGLKATALKKMGIPIDNIDVRRPKTYDEIEKLYWETKALLDENPHAIAGMVFDSYTELQAILVEHAVVDRVNKEIKKETNSQSPENADPFFTGRNDYGKWTNQARKLTRKFRDLPCHIAFGTLEKRDTESGFVKLLPQLTQAFRTDMLGYVDMVAHMITTESDYVNNEDGIEYLGIMRGIKMYCGKDRFSVTPKVLANPSFDRLVALLEGKLDLSGTSDPAQTAYKTRMAAKIPQPAPENKDTDNEG